MKIFGKRFWTKPLAATLGLSFLIPFTAAEARITFKAPIGLGVPGRRVAGGSRSMEHNCLSADQRLVAIVPKSNIVLTTSGNPVLYFYVPQNSAPEIQMVVQDQDNNQKFVKQTYKPSGKGGIFGVPLTATTLEVGKEYNWFFSIVCNPKERSMDKVVNGSIKRINPEPQLLTKLKDAPPKERVNIYATSGIWGDSLANLARLLYSSPNDPDLKADWKELLTAEGVNLEQESAGLVNEPLLPQSEVTKLN